MARVTRSGKRIAATPTATPSKAAPEKIVIDLVSDTTNTPNTPNEPGTPIDPDTPIASVEVPSLKKESKGPYARKPRKRRQRDVKYKNKMKAKGVGLQQEKLQKLKLPQPEREALRAGIHGPSTSQKLSSIVLEQRAEIARLRKQLQGDSKSSQEKATTSHTGSAAQAGTGKRQRKSIP